ncbi:MAG: FAD-dependent oxidoreductase [Candidatus Melainabacteria bacterium]|nr:MAG: FAD-dependent oxidoreductase [Candidatus Melainabacteria bacterium]
MDFNAKSKQKSFHIGEKIERMKGTNPLDKKMEKEKYDTKFDVIVVGAGLSGVSAAITLAKANKKVLLIERGDYAGSKTCMVALCIPMR